MPLTEDRIRACSDEELFELISSELRERLPDSPSYDFDLFMAKLRQLPIGLRAMAATYELDVSMCLEDFCWHFRKWSDPAYGPTRKSWSVNSRESRQWSSGIQRGGSQAG